MKVGIVDYGMGNLRSVYKALEQIGVDSEVTSDYKSIKRFDKLLLPGVGHFKQGVENIKKLNLYDSIKEFVEIKKRPIIGICLGMQLLARKSEEGFEDGFGWIEADIVKFKVGDELKYKIPHMGWNTLRFDSSNSIFYGISELDEFYFVHSYYANINDKSQILAYTTYEKEFVSAVQRNNIIGFQFHPEKSHLSGKKLLTNCITKDYV